jgi:hypothetical protein
VKLKEAIEIYKKETGAISNSYDWHKKCATVSGCITIGNVKIKAKKIGGHWEISKAQFEKGIEAHKLGLKKIQLNTKDYEKGIFHGKRIKIITDWGYYINFGDFRLAVNSVDTYRRKNNGVWYCNGCKKDRNRNIQRMSVIFVRGGVIVKQIVP